MFCLHLRNPFKSKRKRKERKTDFDFHSIDKYISNHVVEGRITTFHCYTRKCGYNLSVYRCVSISSNDEVKFEESIRIEQNIEKATGRVAKEVKLTFGETFRKMKVDFAAAEKLDEKPSFLVSVFEHYDHFKKKYYVVVKEEHLTTVECVGCGCKTEFWNMVRKYDGERLKWFFGRKSARWAAAEEPEKGEKQSL